MKSVVTVGGVVQNEYLLSWVTPDSTCKKNRSLVHDYRKSIPVEGGGIIMSYPCKSPVTKNHLSMSGHPRIPSTATSSGAKEVCRIHFHALGLTTWWPTANRVFVGGLQEEVRGPLSRKRGGGVSGFSVSVSCGQPWLEEAEKNGTLDHYALEVSELINNNREIDSLLRVLAPPNIFLYAKFIVIFSFYY